MTNSTRRRAAAAVVATSATAAVLLSALGPATASSHREAPLITEDPVADGTDLYAFVPTGSDRIVLVSNWIPLQDPFGGPNYFTWGDDVLYTISIDNDGDAVEDLVYEWTFRTETPSTPGLNTLANYAVNNGPITVAGDGYSDTFRRPQTYTLTVYDVDGGDRTVLVEDGLVPPNNIGPRSTPDYQDLVDAAIYDDGTIRSFAGQRDEVFPVDLGAVFDLGGVRPINSAHLLPPNDDAPSIDATNGKNVHSVVLEVPIADVTAGDETAIGIWSDTFRRKTRVFTGNDGAQLEHKGPWVQVSRLGNPLVNELVVPLTLKDTFNASEPADDAQFAPAVLQPTLDDTLLLLYGDSGAFGCYPDSGVAEAGPGTDDEVRDDLAAIFLTGLDGAALGADWDNRVGAATASEMLRIDTAGTSGFPNGRRLEDDVVDIALQAVVGAFGACNGSGAGTPPIGDNSMAATATNRALGDGLAVNGGPGEPDLLGDFPYLPNPHSGYFVNSDEDEG